MDVDSDRIGSAYLWQGDEHFAQEDVAFDHLDLLLTFRQAGLGLFLFLAQPPRNHAPDEELTESLVSVETLLREPIYDVDGELARRSDVSVEDELRLAPIFIARLLDVATEAELYLLTFVQNDLVTGRRTPVITWKRKRR